MRLPGSRGMSSFTRDLEEILTPPAARKPLPSPTPQIITQADVDEAARKFREEKERVRAREDKEPTHAGSD